MVDNHTLLNCKALIKLVKDSERTKSKMLLFFNLAELFDFPGTNDTLLFTSNEGKLKQSRQRYMDA